MLVRKGQRTLKLILKAKIESTLFGRAVKLHILYDIDMALQKIDIL